MGPMGWIETGERERAEKKIPDFREEVEIQVAEEGGRKEGGREVGMRELSNKCRRQAGQAAGYQGRAGGEDGGTKDRPSFPSHE